MNAKLWRDRGFFTLFRKGVCILVRKSDGAARCAPVSMGEWLKLDEFEQFEPCTVSDADKHSLRYCYCDCGCGTCDFCVDIRPAPEGLNEWAKVLPWEVAA